MSGDDSAEKRLAAVRKQSEDVFGARRRREEGQQRGEEEWNRLNADDVDLWKTAISEFLGDPPPPSGVEEVRLTKGSKRLFGGCRLSSTPPAPSHTLFRVKDYTDRDESRRWVFVADGWTLTSWCLPNEDPHESGYVRAGGLHLLATGEVNLGPDSPLKVPSGDVQWRHYSDFTPLDFWNYPGFDYHPWGIPLPAHPYSSPGFVLRVLWESMRSLADFQLGTNRAEAVGSWLVAQAFENLLSLSERQALRETFPNRDWSGFTGRDDH